MLIGAMATANLREVIACLVKGSTKVTCTLLALVVSVLPNEKFIFDE